MVKIKNARPNIICCGNIAFDLILNKNSSRDHLIFSAYPGGSVLNTALLMSRLGLSVSILSKTGKDFLGNALLRFIQKEKLKINNVFQDKNTKTGLAFAKIDKKGDSSYVFYKPDGKSNSFKKNQLSQKIFKRASVLHSASAHSYSDFTFENTLSLMKYAKKEDIFISYDPNWRGYRIKNKRKARKRIHKLLPYVDLLKLSESDALGITGGKTLSSALARLPSNIVVTLGERGSFFWDGKKRIFCPSFKVKTADTIGAGDGFTAGLIYRYYVLGKECFWEKKKENLKFASAVSALVCKGKGSMGELKNLRQVQQYLKSR